MAIIRVLLVLFVTWLILADCVLARHTEPFPHPSAAIMLGLLLGEAGLVASWFACARQHWLTRLAVVWVVMAVLAWPAALYSGPSWRAWAGLLLLFSGGIAFGWKLMHASGWQLEWPTSFSTRRATNLRGYQFSLASLMELTTIVAATLGLASWLALPDRQPVIAACGMLLLSTLPPLCCWLVMAETQRVWSRLGPLLAMLLVTLLFVGLHHASGLSAMMSLLPCALAIVSLLGGTVVSLGGGRLVHVTESKSSPAPWALSPPPVDAL